MHGTRWEPFHSVLPSRFFTNQKQYDSRFYSKPAYITCITQIGNPELGCYKISPCFYFPPETPGTAPVMICQIVLHLNPSNPPCSSLGRSTEQPASPSNRPSLGPTTASSLGIAKNWLDNCCANHQLCRTKFATQEAAWFPTRLLYFTGGTVQLIETDKTNPTTPYMTVTHRWGFDDGGKMMMLNRNTYASLREGIQISSMPRLFQEVISVALRLGVNYIWIDAFCIFQDKDDQTDWQHEASHMAKVYRNSFCNISAADATCCSDTLFSRPRDPQEEIFPQEIHLDFISDSSSSSTITKAGTRTEYFTLTNLSQWTHEVPDALVNTRAWVLQERVLSPRILHFGRRQLFWECYSKEACEVFLDGEVPPGVVCVSGGFKRFDTPGLITELANDEKLYHTWNRLIRTYTKTNLSYPSDKLIAISGLAKLFALKLGDNYLAGLWRRYVEGGLLWCKSIASDDHYTEKANTRRPEKYRAPSWSWASVDGSVNPGLARKGPEFRYVVEDVQLSYLTEDKTGEVTGGWLRLRGTLLETELVRVSRRCGMPVWMLNLEGLSFFGEKSAAWDLNPLVHLDVAQDDFTRERDEHLLYSMVAWIYSEGEVVSTLALLFRLVDREKGVFQRLGIIHMMGDVMQRAVLELKRGLDKPRLPSVELHDDGQHSIIVI